MKRAAVAGMAWLCILAVHPTPAQMCIGDCDHTGAVTSGDVLTLVDIALGSAERSACAGGLGSNAQVDIAASIQAVNNALDGCTVPMTPTSAPANTATDTPAGGSTGTPSQSPGNSATETPPPAATSTRTPVPTRTPTAPPPPTRTGTATQIATNPPNTATETPSATPRPTTHTVLVGPSGMLVFSPSDLTIHVGDTVLWRWSSSGHSVVSGSDCTADGQFCSPGDQGCDRSALSSKGATYQHTFTTPGTHPYFCNPHCDLGMVGTITVQ